jgi:hypothetical protein
MNRKHSTALEKKKSLYSPTSPKICEDCRLLVPLEDFRADRRHSDGRVLVCKSCERAARKKLRAARRESYARAIEKWKRTQNKGGVR